jgi:hypothetical protein
MTSPDDRARTAADSVQGRPPAPPTATLAPVYRYLILLNAALSAAGLAAALVAIAHAHAAVPAGDPARPPVSACLAPATSTGRDAMAQIAALPPQLADSPRPARPADAVLGCRPLLI